MLRKRLTEEGVAKLKTPAKGQVDYFDDDMRGLILRLGYGGSKTWLVRDYLRRVKNGKTVSIPTTYKLGRYPFLKVKEAREKARVFRGNPAKARAQADTGSFREVAENFIKRYVETEKKLRTRDEIVRLLNTLVYPHWEVRQFRDIKRADVADLLDYIVDNHGARQADKALAIIRRMCNWFASRDSDYISPVVKGMGRYAAADRKRDRVLGNVPINNGDDTVDYDDSELRALWQVCGDMGTFGALLKTLLLTGQRREKVLRMRWDDISDGVWAIPTAKREKGNAGRVKLPPSLLDIVNAQPQIAGNPYVFAGRGSGPFNNFSQRTHELNKKLSEKLGEVQQWQLHDLRRTARSLMSRAGVRPDIAERVLGHVRPGVEGIYDRHHYDSDKADALARLAALVESIINPPPANVVPLTKQKRAPRGARTKLRPPAGSKDVTSRAFGMTFIGAEAFRPKKP